MKLLEMLRGIEKIQINNIEIPINGITCFNIEEQDVIISTSNATIFTKANDINVVLK